MIWGKAMFIKCLVTSGKSNSTGLHTSTIMRLFIRGYIAIDEECDQLSHQFKDTGSSRQIIWISVSYAIWIHQLAHPINDFRIEKV